MKDFFKKMIELDTYEINKPKKPEIKAFKMPIMKTIFYPFSAIVDNFKNISILIGIYSGIITILSLLVGYSFLCSYPGAELTNLHCSEFGYLYAFYFFVKMILISGFVIGFYNIISGQKFEVKNILKFNFRNIKVFGMLILLMFINIIPLISFNILFERVPNPNWVIEAAFFTVFAMGFLAPFIVMRFYGAFGFYIETGTVTFASLCRLWEKTKGNTLKIVIGLFLITMFSIIAMANYYVNFKGIFDLSNVLYSATTSEFFYNIILLLILSLMVGHFYVQRTILIMNAANDE